jgi:TRAP-type C4-dicarboxylate transport system substrate-binding protein
MVRKIRMGILGGAVFTSLGITNIYPDAYVLNVPFFIESDKEMDYIMEKMTPIFEKEIEKKGFKVILWSRAGWVNFFSKNPIIYPDDLKKHKLSFTTGAPEMEQAWKKSGYQVVPNELKDVMMGLQSGMITAFYLPPLMAASGQYFALAPNMLPLNIAPMVGGFVISKKIWDEIPEKYKNEMISVAQKMADNLFKKTDELEKEAMAEMKKNGLIVNKVPPDAMAKWREASAKGMDELIGKAFSKEIYDLLVKYVDEYRKLNAQK